jgi:hypothetical protein
MWDSLWQGLIMPLFDLDGLLIVLKFLDPWQTVELRRQTCPELGWVVFVHSLAQADVAAEIREIMTVLVYFCYK